MRVFVVHDEAGNIIGLAIPPESVEAGTFGLIAEAGHYTSEIEVQDARSKRSELLANLAKNYRVERLTTARLVKTKPEKTRRPPAKRPSNAVKKTRRKARVG